MVKKVKGPGSFKREQTDENGLKLGTFEFINFDSDEIYITDGISNWIVKESYLTEDENAYYINNNLLVNK
jgi:hypothetical protein